MTDARGHKLKQGLGQLDNGELRRIVDHRNRGGRLVCPSTDDENDDDRL